MSRRREWAFVMGRILIRLLLGTSAIIVVRMMSVSRERADDQGGTGRCVGTWHPARWQKGAQHHRDQRDVHRQVFDADAHIFPDATIGLAPRVVKRVVWNGYLGNILNYAFWK
jgi:hypothetical protein